VLGDRDVPRVAPQDRVDGVKPEESASGAHESESGRKHRLRAGLVLSDSGDLDNALAREPGPIIVRTEGTLRLSPGPLLNQLERLASLVERGELCSSLLANGTVCALE